jgi:hypothetical protein
MFLKSPEQEVCNGIIHRGILGEQFFCEDTMTKYEPIDYTHKAMAEAILDVSSGYIKNERSDRIPYIEEMVVGAAMALEKGGIFISKEDTPSRTSKAEEWLDTETVEGNHLSTAVARVLMENETNSSVKKTPKEIMGQIVADTINTVAADHIFVSLNLREAVALTAEREEKIENAQEKAIDDVIKMDGIIGGHKLSERLKLAYGDPYLTRQTEYEAFGKYEMLSPIRNREIERQLTDLSQVPEASKKAIDVAAQDIEAIRKNEIEAASYVNSRVADFKEAGSPLFTNTNGISDAKADELEATFARHDELFHRDGNPPTNALEAGVFAHILITKDRIARDTDGNPSGDEIGAEEARAYMMMNAMNTEQSNQTKEPLLNSPVAVAMQIQGMQNIMSDAYKTLYSENTRMSSAEQRDLETLSKGEFWKLPEEAQIGIFESLNKGRAVTPTQTMQILDGVRKAAEVDYSMQKEAGQGKDEIRMTNHVVRPGGPELDR